MGLRAQQIIAGLKVPLLGRRADAGAAGSGEDYGYYTQAYSYYSSETKEDNERGGKRRGADGPGSGRESINLK